MSAENEALGLERSDVAFLGLPIFRLFFICLVARSCRFSPCASILSFLSTLHFCPFGLGTTACTDLLSSHLGGGLGDTFFWSAGCSALKNHRPLTGLDCNTNVFGFGNEDPRSLAMDRLSYEDAHGGYTQHIYIQGMTLRTHWGGLGGPRWDYTNGSYDLAFLGLCFLDGTHGRSSGIGSYGMQCAGVVCYFISLSFWTWQKSWI